MSLLNLCIKSTKNFQCAAIPKLIISRTLAKSLKKSHGLKVTVIGGAGRVGQPLCLMLKQSPLIDELSIYDIIDPCQFATELGHVDTRCKISSYLGTDEIQHALCGAKIVVVLAAARRSAYLSYNSMFTANAGIILNLIHHFANCCPNALLAIATNPVNNLVPLASEMLKKNGVYNPYTVFGVTTLNCVRANVFVSDVLGLEPECVFVPVIGGHANKTIVPVFSQAQPCCDFTNEELEKLTEDVQNAHYDILKAKSKESASLSCAFAVARFVISLVKGIRNMGNIVECAYVKSDVHPKVSYLSTPILLGPRGILRNYGLPKMTQYEKCLLDNATTLLVDDIDKGEHFVLTEGDSIHEDPPICKPAKDKSKCATVYK